MIARFLYKQNRTRGKTRGPADTQDCKLSRNVLTDRQLSHRDCITFTFIGKY